MGLKNVDGRSIRPNWIEYPEPSSENPALVSLHRRCPKQPLFEVDKVRIGLSPKARRSACRVGEGKAGMAADEAPDGSIFLHLKSYCIDLLHLLHSPRKSSPALTALADLLRRAPPDALQPCLE